MYFFLFRGFIVWHPKVTIQNPKCMGSVPLSHVEILIPERWTGDTSSPGPRTEWSWWWRGDWILQMGTAYNQVHRDAGWAGIPSVPSLGAVEPSWLPESINLDGRRLGVPTETQSLVRALQEAGSIFPVSAQKSLLLCHPTFCCLVTRAPNYSTRRSKKCQQPHYIDPRKSDIRHSFA